MNTREAITACTLAHGDGSGEKDLDGPDIFLFMHGRIERVPAEGPKIDERPQSHPPETGHVALLGTEIKLSQPSQSE